MDLPEILARFFAAKFSTGTSPTSLVLARLRTYVSQDTHTWTGGVIVHHNLVIAYSPVDNEEKQIQFLAPIASLYGSKWTTLTMAVVLSTDRNVVKVNIYGRVFCPLQGFMVENWP